MKLKFKVLKTRERASPSTRGEVLLTPGDWDDYSFKTSFGVALQDKDGRLIDLGTVKIGYVGQKTGWTREKLPPVFEKLPEAFFPLGQDVSYYKTLCESLDDEVRRNFLEAMRDVVHDDGTLSEAVEEKVFADSLTRGVSSSTLKVQFKRVLRGLAELTDFYFAYTQAGGSKIAAFDLEFSVTASSSPSTNVHVLIGRNGIGKTTLLNGMVHSLMGQQDRRAPGTGKFWGGPIFGDREPLAPDYFSSVVSVSFSAFDPFTPPPNRQDRSKGLGFFYVGMKRPDVAGGNQSQALKTRDEISTDFGQSFRSCLSESAKRERWRRAIRRLESDFNFADMEMESLLSADDPSALQRATSVFQTLSSGHAIVLLAITKLVDTVEEKTLVLLDEPESHLHPPLLSAFTRALSDLLHDRNGVAIVATHSPVVLQEVPKSCVWKLSRIRSQGKAERLERETFGENVGVLTREVFGLELAKSGFHEMLQSAVDRGGSFEEILKSYGGQIGTEAKAILLSLIVARDSARKQPE